VTTAGFGKEDYDDEAQQSIVIRAGNVESGQSDLSNGQAFAAHPVHLVSLTGIANGCTT
jgi:hypothetical protein